MPNRRKLTADSLTPLPQGERARRSRLSGVTAWLIQWVPVDVAEKPLELANPSSRNSVASILSARVSHDRVRDIAKAIYLAECADPAAMLALYRMEGNSRRSPAATPVTPTYATLEAEFAGEGRRLPFVGRFRFGRDPCLYARRVKNLHEREDGTLDWDEISVLEPRTAPNE